MFKVTKMFINNPSLVVTMATNDLVRIAGYITGKTAYLAVITAVVSGGSFMGAYVANGCNLEGIAQGIQRRFHPTTTQAEAQISFDSKSYVPGSQGALKTNVWYSPENGCADRGIQIIPGDAYRYLPADKAEDATLESIPLDRREPLFQEVRKLACDQAIAAYDKSC